MITVREMTSDDHAAVLAVVESLTEWFSETARHQEIPIDLKHQKVFVALQEAIPVGFVTLYVAEGRLNIGWLCVRKDVHHRSIGRALLARAEQQARALGINELATHTLGENVHYAPYEPTRAFCFTNGFRVHQRARTDNLDCPEVIWISKRITMK